MQNDFLNALFEALSFYLVAGSVFLMKIFNFSFCAFIAPVLEIESQTARQILDLVFHYVYGAVIFTYSFLKLIDYIKNRKNEKD